MERNLEEIKSSLLEDLADHPELRLKLLKNWMRYKASVNLVWESRKPDPQIQLLDYGCGHPFVSRILSDLGYQVTAYDPYADEEFQTASLLGIGHLFRKELPPGMTFDIVLMIDVLEHLSIVKTIMQHVNQLTADHGLLIVSTPNVLRLETWLWFLLRKRGHPESITSFLESDNNYTRHQREYTPEELDFTLKRFGYQVNTLKGIHTRDRQALEEYYAFVGKNNQKKHRVLKKIYHLCVDGSSKWFPESFANNLFAVGQKKDNL